MQVINDTTFGGNLGTAFGTGLGNVLSGLAEAKAQQLHQRQTAAALQKFPGLNLSAQDADELSYLATTHPQLFNMAVKQKLQTSGNQNFIEGLAREVSGYNPSNVQQAQNVTGPVPARQEGNALQQLMGSRQQQPQMGFQNPFQQLIASQFNPQLPGLENFGPQNQIQTQEYGQPNIATAQAQRLAPQPQQGANLQPQAPMSPEQEKYNQIMKALQNATPEQALKYLKSTTAAKKEIRKGAPELKHDDALNAQLENLDDIINTADRMLNTINKGVSTGVIANLQGKFAPSWLDENSELLDKDAAHLINTTSAEIKGVPSVFRVKLLEKEKPGLQHSVNVNKQILNRAKQQAIEKKNSLLKRYPQLGGAGNETNAQSNLTTFKGNFIQDPNGNPFGWDKSLNKYRPLRRKA